MFIFTRFMSTKHLGLSAFSGIMRCLALFHDGKQGVFRALCSWGSTKLSRFLLELRRLIQCFKLSICLPGCIHDLNFIFQAIKACLRIFKLMEKVIHSVILFSSFSPQDRSCYTPSFNL